MMKVTFKIWHSLNTLANACNSFMQQEYVKLSNPEKHFLPNSLLKKGSSNKA